MNGSSKNLSRLGGTIAAFALAIFACSTLGTASADTINLGSGESPGFNRKYSDAETGKDGSITILGTGQAVSLTRFTAGGHPDPSFGEAGTALFHSPSENRFASRDIALTSNGAILIAAELREPCGYKRCNPDRAGVGKVNPEGVLDRDFGRRGIARVPGVALAQAVYSLPNGKILLAGSGDWRLRLWRLNRDGSLDRSFGHDGEAAIPFRSHNKDVQFKNASAIAVDQGGRIYVSGTAGGQMIVARIKASGKPDWDFGTGAAARLRQYSGNLVGLIARPEGGFIGSQGWGGCSPLYAFDDEGEIDGAFNEHSSASVGSGCDGASSTYPVSVATDAQGRITVFGRSYQEIGLTSRFRVERYLADGSFDPTFADSGRAEFPVEPGQIYDGVLDPQGRPAMVGNEPGPATYDRTGVVARLTPQGTPDPTFGDGGVVKYSPGSASNDRAAMIFEAPGGFVIAGGSDADRTTPSSGSTYLSSQIKVNTSGRLDRSYGDRGRVLTDLDGSNGYEGTKVLAATQGSKTLLAGSRYVDDNDYGFAIARFGENGRPDPAFGDAGLKRPNLPDRFFPNLIAADKSEILLADRQRSGARIARLTADGALVKKFGIDGMVNVRLPYSSGSSVVAERVDVDREGRALITLTQQICGTSCDLTEVVLLRLNADGRADAGFGKGGQRVLRTRRFNAMDLAPDGHITIAGTFCRRPPEDQKCPEGRLLFSLGPDGGLERSFGRHGISRSALRGVKAHAVTRAGGGSVIVAGESRNRPATLAFGANGRPVGPWGKHGVKTVRQGFEGAFHAVTPTGGRKVMAAGWIRTSEGADDYLTTTLKAP